MRRGLVLGAFGALALVVQGSLARFVTPAFAPDLGLLMVVGSTPDSDRYFDQPSDWRSTNPVQSKERIAIALAPARSLLVTVGANEVTVVSRFASQRNVSSASTRNVAVYPQTDAFSVLTIPNCQIV